MKFSVIDAPFLVASSIPFNARDIRALHQQRVRAIVSLTTRSLIGLSDITQDLFVALDMVYLHSPIRDHYPPTPEQAEEILEFIERMKRKQRKTFIHCHAGVGRTGTILHAYFVRQGLSLGEAEAKVKECRIQCMLVSDEQKKFLREFAEKRQYSG